MWQPRTSPIAQHGRLPRRAGWRLVLAFIASAVAVAVVSTGSVAAIAIWRLQSDIRTETIDADRGDPPPSLAEYEGGFNILIIGSDTRDGQTTADYGHVDSVLNDVNMLLHVAQDQQSATLVSIPRDLVVPMPECENGGPATGVPMNSTLYYGGMNCVVSTVQNLTGLEIQFAGIIEFDGVIKMSDAIGGVDVCIDAPIIDGNTGINLPAAGTYSLRGFEALAFLRSRKGVGDGSDLGRISSQQVYLSSLVRKIKSDGTLNDLAKLYGLAQAATQSMTLSERFARLDTLVQVAMVLRKIPLENITMVQYPGTTGGTGIYAGKVQPIAATAKKLFDAIAADQPIRLTEDSLGLGATVDPNAAPPSPAPSSSPTASPTAPPAPEGVVVPGLQGQPAAMATCAAAN